jgi:hypothetical protein
MRASRVVTPRSIKAAKSSVLMTKTTLGCRAFTSSRQ